MFRTSYFYFTLLQLTPYSVVTSPNLTQWQRMTVHGRLSLESLVAQVPKTQLKHTARDAPDVSTLAVCLDRCGESCVMTQEGLLSGLLTYQRHSSARDTSLQFVAPSNNRALYFNTMGTMFVFGVSQVNGSSFCKYIYISKHAFNQFWRTSEMWYASFLESGM